MEQWGTGKKQLYFGVRDSYEEEGKISSGDLPSASGCTEIERIAYSKDKIVHITVLIHVKGLLFSTLLGWEELCASLRDY